MEYDDTIFNKLMCDEHIMKVLSVRSVDILYHHAKKRFQGIGIFDNTEDHRISINPKGVDYCKNQLFPVYSHVTEVGRNEAKVVCCAFIRGEKHVK